MSKEKQGVAKNNPIEDRKIYLYNSGYTAGKLFSRVDNSDSSIGYGVFTGEFKHNIDGVTMIFTDGKEVLEDFCTFVTENSDEVMDYIKKESDRYAKERQDFIQNIQFFKETCEREWKSIRRSTIKCILDNEDGVQ